MAGKSVPGIYVRHSRSCRSHSGETCNCKPSYQAHVWSKKDNQRIKKTFPGLAAAKAWRADAISALNKGTMRAPTPDTVRHAGEALIAGMRDGSIRDRSGKEYKPSTIRSYEQSLEKHVYPELGARKLSSITYPDLQDFVDRLAAKGLDGSTIRNAIMPLRVIFRRARYQIPVNPTTGLEMKARRNKSKRVVAPDVAAKLLDALPFPDQAIWATGLYAGLRKGELQALRVEDVELFPDGRWGLIHVRQSWDTYEGAQSPKSAAGIRTVPIPEPLYEILDEHLLRLGRSEGLIFGKTATEPFNYHTLRERTERAWRKAELGPSDLQLHEGRHSYSSFLSAAGVPDSRADRYMGHANHTVQGRYRHQLDPQYLDDAKTFTEYLLRADTPTRAGQLRDSEGQSVAV